MIIGYYTDNGCFGGATYTNVEIIQHNNNQIEFGNIESIYGEDIAIIYVGY